jgi:hypothetical protein
MTELVRRAIRAIPRLAGPAASEPSDQDVPRAGVEISATADVLARCGSDAADALDAGLQRLCGELHLGTDVDVTTVAAPAGSPDVAISINGRPLALTPAHIVVDSDRPADVVYQRAMHGTLRRLPLLLGEQAKPGVAAYLLGVGCAVPKELTDTGPDIVAAERVFDEVAPRKIVLEVAAETMRRVDDAGRMALAAARETEFLKRGVRYPDVRVEVVDGRPGTLGMRLNDVTLPLMTLPDDAGWADVVRRLMADLEARRHWFIRLSEVDRTLWSDLERLFPELVAATLRAFSREEIVACLRELLRSGRRIRNVPRIMALMLEQGDAHGKLDVLRLSESPLTPRGGHRTGSGRDPLVLAARVGKLAAEESWRLGRAPVISHVRRLDADLEARLLAGAHEAEWEVVRALTEDREANRIVTRTIEAIGPVRDAVQALEKPPRVLASQELPPDADLDLFTVVGEGARGNGTRARHRPSLRHS